MSGSIVMHDELALEQRLRDQLHFRSGPIAVIAGHYALGPDATPALEPHEDGSFGIFPTYTLELGARLVAYAKKNGFQAKLALLVDDHSQMRNRQWYLSPSSEPSTASAVAKYFEEFTLPATYQEILKRNGCSERDFVASANGLAFQETLYRQAFELETGLDPGCAGEMRMILEELAHTGIRKVVGMIPEPCAGPTCAAVGFYRRKHNPKLPVTFAYFPTGPRLEKPENLWFMARELHGGIRIISP
jgi:hypothetical protein